MKIGFDAKRLFCNSTGLGNYSRTLVYDLAQLYPGHHYNLYTPEIRHSPVTQRFTDNPAFHLHTPRTAFKSYWRSVSMVRQLKADKLDLYHGLSNELPYRICKSGIRSIVTVHDLIFKIYPETFSLSEQFIYDLKFKYACKYSSRIIAISENTKNDIVHFYDIEPDKIEIIYQACNPLYYKLQSPLVNQQVLQQYGLPEDYLLYVGSVEERKNLKLIIEAYPLLPPDLRIPLIIVGKGGKYKQKIMSLAEKLGVSRYLTWLSNLQSNEHLQSIYQEARALLYPSLYEGFGLPVAEALLCKTPVITALTSALSDAGGNSSLYIDPYSPEDMAAAISRVLTDDILVEQMREDGYQYAHEQFTSDVLTRKMMQCYQKTMEGEIRRRPNPPFN